MLKLRYSGDFKEENFTDGEMKYIFTAEGRSRGRKAII